MKKSAEQFAGGDLSHRLTSPATEEMAGLADAMNQMAAQLDNRIETIISQRNQLETVLSSMLEGVVAVDNKERIIVSTGPPRNYLKVIRKLPGQKYSGSHSEPAAAAVIRKTISSRELKEDDIILYQNGEKILNLQSSPLMDAGKEQIGTLLVINEVTQLRRLEICARTLSPMYPMK